jgi:hypothetical protein
MSWKKEEITKKRMASSLEIRSQKTTYFCRAFPIPAALSAFFGLPLRDVPWFFGMLNINPISRFTVLINTKKSMWNEPVCSL